MTTDIDEPMTPFNDFYDISSKKFKKMMDISAFSQKISQQEIEKIELSTRGQSDCNIWFEERKYRLTASNFYTASRNKFEPSTKLKSMFYTNFSSNSTQHALSHEKTCSFIVPSTSHSK